MKMYKGFDKDMKCRGFQYEVGQTYETDEAKLCESGFHACEAPLDVFRYYAPTDSRYCEVELDDLTDKRSDDSKRVGKKITVGAEIGIPGLIKAHVEWVKANLEKNKAATNTGDRSAATNTGYWSAATNTGNRSAATNTGDRSAAEVSGMHSVAIAVGYNGKARGSLGCAIVVAERDSDGKILSICAAVVDGEKIKPDTWYTVRNGEWVEVADDE